MAEVDGCREKQPSITALVASIANDAAKLIEQQFVLLRQEVADEIHQARVAAIAMATGAGLAATGGFLILLMIVYGLNAWTELPLWSCYGLVGGLAAGMGGLVLYFGTKKAADIQLMPPPQTAEAVKENVEWLKNPTLSRNP
jgi:hypothetical protein